MPYRHIQFVQECYYHIYNRGAFYKKVFFNHNHYMYCLRLLRKNAKRFHVSFLAYCLMPNHYHFLVRPDSEKGVSECIGYTFNAYTQAVNKQMNRNGSIFQGPFKAIPIDKNEYLMHLCRYIHMNPVKAGLVQKPGEWPYSNYREWISASSQKSRNLLKDKNVIIFDPAVIDMYFENGQQYMQFVEEEIDQPKELGKYLMD